MSSAVTLKVGIPGAKAIVETAMFLRAVDQPRYVEFCNALAEMEGYYTDKALNSPDDNSTFTAKGYARGVREIRRLVTDALRITEETAPRR